jgi:hypothetical protein
LLGSKADTSTSAADCRNVRFGIGWVREKPAQCRYRARRERCPLVEVVRDPRCAVRFFGQSRDSRCKRRIVDHTSNDLLNAGQRPFVDRDRSMTGFRERKPAQDNASSWTPWRSRRRAAIGAASHSNAERQMLLARTHQERCGPACREQRLARRRPRGRSQRTPAATPYSEKCFELWLPKSTHPCASTCSHTKRTRRTDRRLLVRAQRIRRSV